MNPHHNKKLLILTDQLITETELVLQAATQELLGADRKVLAEAEKLTAWAAEIHPHIRGIALDTWRTDTLGH